MTAAGDLGIRRELNTPDQVYSAGDDAPLASEGSMETRSEKAAKVANGTKRTAGQAPLAPGPRLAT
jgi:hypothetical protein